jgi:nitroreductase
VSNNKEEEKPSSTSSLEATIITKTAKTDHPINELIAKRWSARAFSTRPVERLKLLSILEAARWGPSSRNEQLWRYIVFTNDNPDNLAIMRICNDCKMTFITQSSIEEHIKTTGHKDIVKTSSGIIKT